MSKWYKINLKPLSSYFFGQELNAEIGNKQSYFQKSAIFPQQSTLLGMLRHQLLLQHGLAKPKVSGATGNPKFLIGDVGFKPDLVFQNYGIIEKLSPVFFQRNGSGHYFLSSKEIVNDNDSECELLTGGEIQYNDIYGRLIRSVNLFYVKDSQKKAFTSKLSFCEYLTDIIGGDKQSISNVVKKVTQVGVYKHTSRSDIGSDNAEAYFKRNSIQFGKLNTIDTAVLERSGIFEKYSEIPLNPAFELAEDWSFAFYVQLSDAKTFSTESPRVVAMGKEQSIFLMTVTDMEELIITSWLDTKESSNKLVKIVLLSDSYIHEDKLLENTLLINGETLRFRSFSRDYSLPGKGIEYTNFARLNFSDKSDCYHLLKRGSVIYTKHPTEISKQINSHNQWRKIGYNHFIIKNS